MMDWVEAGSIEALGSTCGAEMTEGGGGGKRRLSLMVVLLEEAAMVEVRVRVRVVARRDDECIGFFAG